MPIVTQALDRHLEALCASAREGERLPTVRSLMREFGVSQMVVQRAFQALKARGLISAHVGRGTYFLSPAGPTAGSVPVPASAGVARTAVPRRRSVLLLRRAANTTRGRALAELLQHRLVADGHSVLEVSYTDPDHARAALQGLPHFDACVVQSSFKAIPTELLAALRQRVEVLAVDGVALVGMDVESVGTEWGEPLEVAVEHLRRLGHRCIGFASSSHQFLATQLGHRRLEQLRLRMPELELPALTLPHLPGPDYELALVEQLRVLRAAAGGPRLTALVAWGIDDGARLRSLLADTGLPVPDALSVVLLGRTDMVQEHADFFETVGCSVADQAEHLHQAITTRWAEPDGPYAVHLIPLTRRAGQSCAPMRASTASVRATDSPT